MGSIPPELSLDLRASFLPKTIGNFLRDALAIGNVDERASKNEGFVKRLEEEMRKIDAFKRELPLCMLLLNDAIVHLKEESAKFESAKIVEPVLEEFMPLKNEDCKEKEEGLNCDNKKDKDCRDKKNWMSSVQLWSTDDDSKTSDLKKNSKTQTKVNEKRNGLESEDPFKGCRNRSVVGGRAFVPFQPCSGFPSARKKERDEFSVQGLSLIIPGIKTEEAGCVGNRSNSSRAVSSSSSPLNAQSNSRAGSAQQHAVRKQRRCWSPELHRRFVNALQQLGGSQVATPKQIRELMQVDGLTNDEVKSHLQKYRLHTRRLPSGSASASAASQSAVVLGGLWMSQDHQYGDSSKASSSQSGSPQGPFQLAQNVSGSGSPTTGDESMEDDDDEDAKSEGYSWKSHIHKQGKDDDVYES